MNLRIKIPAGEHVRVFPFVEERPQSRGFRLVPRNPAAVAADFTLKVTTRADLASSTPLERTRDAQGHWTFAHPGTIQSHDCLILKWDEALKDKWEVRAAGRDAEGAPFLRAWNFDGASGARIAILSLGAAEGVKLMEVAVRGAGETMTCELAPLVLAP